jgi:hypothetical protein
MNSFPVKDFSSEYFSSEYVVHLGSVEPIPYCGSTELPAHHNLGAKAAARVLVNIHSHGLVS